MTLDLTPNYWLSLAIIAVPIVLLTLLGVLVIRIVGRAAERRLANSALVSNEEAVDASAVRADDMPPVEVVAVSRTNVQPGRHARLQYAGQGGAVMVATGSPEMSATQPAAGSSQRWPGRAHEPYPDQPDSSEPSASASARTTYPSVPITYRDLPSFVRQRRRPGESFTEFSRRIGL